MELWYAYQSLTARLQVCVCCLFFLFFGGGGDFHCHDCTCSFLKLEGLQVVKMYFAVLEIVNICSFTGSLYYTEVGNKAIHLHLCLSIECL